MPAFLPRPLPGQLLLCPGLSGRAEYLTDSLWWLLSLSKLGVVRGGSQGQDTVVILSRIGSRGQLAVLASVPALGGVPGAQGSTGGLWPHQEVWEILQGQLRPKDLGRQPKYGCLGVVPEGNWVGRVTGRD